MDSKFVGTLLGTDDQRILASLQIHRELSIWNTDRHTVHDRAESAPAVSNKIIVPLNGS
jgi:hypothetical protein